jgi:hypothetical protein
MRTVMLTKPGKDDVMGMLTSPRMNARTTCAHLLALPDASLSVPASCVRLSASAEYIPARLPGQAEPHRLLATDEAYQQSRPRRLRRQAWRFLRHTEEVMTEPVILAVNSEAGRGLCPLNLL